MRFTLAHIHTYVIHTCSRFESLVSLRQRLHKFGILNYLACTRKPRPDFKSPNHKYTKALCLTQSLLFGVQPVIRVVEGVCACMYMYMFIIDIDDFTINLDNLYLHTCIPRQALTHDTTSGATSTKHLKMSFKMRAKFHSFDSQLQLQRALLVLAIAFCFLRYTQSIHSLTHSHTHTHIYYN